MPEPSRRVRSKKRRQTKSSKRKNVVHYYSKKTSVTRCSNCGKELAGLPRSGPCKLGKLPVTQRRVERIYSGNLCHSCLRSLLIRAARNL